MQVELWFLISEHCLVVLHTCTKFRENISNANGSELLSGHDFHIKITQDTATHFVRVEYMYVCLSVCPSQTQAVDLLQTGS